MQNSSENARQLRSDELSELHSFFERSDKRDQKAIVHELLVDMVVNCGDWSQTQYQEVREVIEKATNCSLPRLEQVGYPSTFDYISHNLFARDNTPAQRESFMIYAIADVWGSSVSAQVREALWTYDLKTR